MFQYIFNDNNLVSKNYNIVVASFFCIKYICLSPLLKLTINDNKFDIKLLKGVMDNSPIIF